ncbi:MAG: 3-keto-disaccharide hydrolase [Sphingobacteriaceae bacterium]
MKRTRLLKMGVLIASAVLMTAVDANAQSAGSGQSLFDGKTLNGWKRLAGKADYKVEDGVIVGTTVMNSGNTFLVTEKEYGDFVLELDAKIESTLSNSGIQTRSHYDPDGNGGKGKVYGRQLEIDPSDRSWSGGIYDEGRRGWLYPLDLHQNAKTAFKVGEYNHIKIECIGNEMKTWINNMPVAYVVDTIDQKGFIGLQVHGISNQEQEGKKVYFKNIKIKTAGLKASAFPAGIYVMNNSINKLTDYEKKTGWNLLFDGKSSAGWKSATGKAFPAKGWEIKNGLISVLPSEGKEAANGGDIVTNKMYNAFDLSFDFRLTPGANSGVKYFVTLDEKTEGSAIGLEYQVLDDESHPDAKLGRDGDRTLASLYDLLKANKNSRFVHPIGDWNVGRVVVYPDNRVEHYLNGVKVLEYVRGSKEFRDLVAISKYKVWPNFGEAPEGHILLQDHGNAVSFRNIKIKELK